MSKYLKILLIINVSILVIALIAKVLQPSTVTAPSVPVYDTKKVLEVKEEKTKSLSTSEKSYIVDKIADTFPENTEVMVAIALKESGLNKNATNYNCFYKVGGDTYDKLIKTYIDISVVSKTRQKGYVSTFCRKGHEKYAWSKDGGIFQINNPTEEHYTIEGNLATARHKYDTQGLIAWTAYKTGAYKKYIPLARDLLNS